MHTKASVARFFPTCTCTRQKNPHNRCASCETAYVKKLAAHRTRVHVLTESTYTRAQNNARAMQLYSSDGVAGAGALQVPVCSTKMALAMRMVSAASMRRGCSAAISMLLSDVSAIDVVYVLHSTYNLRHVGRSVGRAGGLAVRARGD